MNTDMPNSAEAQDGAEILVANVAAGVASITLNRPRARNALTFESWRALDSALERVASDQDARVIVLTASGGYFSAGGDLKTPPSAGFRANAPIARLELAQRTISHMMRHPLPIIAAVEGGAAGLGWSLALACDLIVASETASFAAPFVARGVPPDGGAAWFLVRRLGRHRAAQILLGDTGLSAVEAQQIGLVNKLSMPGEAFLDAVKLAEAMPSTAPHAMELAKRLITSAENLAFSDYLDLEMNTATLAQLGPESQQARKAFQEKHDK